ncbi:hypothetical protein PUR61_09415 [Streptomyces sp. BE20]|uniref:hypothetical protein n=1 Tax=Streptomyces sp. BE20 TaxID=3002525 RepID=UPI002E79EF69|nr:hypothetical protein [Streptomyces sp. BE20]MEE1822410.1 hypothetical protein [Streptomyces sp. BE20]
MVRFTPNDPTGIAVNAGGTGPADFTVNPSGTAVGLEIWHRTVRFDPAAPPPPPFVLGPVWDPPHPTRALHADVPVGGLYQARLFEKGRGSAALAEKPPPELLVGRVDTPCAGPKTRLKFLTACIERPQTLLTPGGTFVTAAFATSAPVMARVQISDSPPQVAPLTGHPFFGNQEVIATATSDRPALMHEFSLIDDLRSPLTSSHVGLRPGTELFFLIVVWDAAGFFDFVWNTTGEAPATPPEKIKVKNRIVEARVAAVHCYEDSDRHSFGEADFTFGLTGGARTVTQTFTWDPMALRSDMTPLPAWATALQLVAPFTDDRVVVWVDATEDDSGSFPSDSDDGASTAGRLGGGAGRGTPLSFPAGEGREQVTDQPLVLHSVPTTDGELLSFSTTVVYSVTYA